MDTAALASRSRTTPRFWDGVDAAPSELAGPRRPRPLRGARPSSLTLAEEQGWLDGADAETHTVPHGDRSKVAIEPFLTDQWYVDAATLAKPALAAVRDGRTRILPERDEKTYFHWLENIEPWCISRQLWWGHQIPVWYGPVRQRWTISTSTETAASAFCAQSRTRLFEQAAEYYASGASSVEVGDVASERDAEGTLESRVCRRSEMRRRRAMAEDVRRTSPSDRDPDVLDTWFSSGIWPIGTLGWPDDTPELRRYYPTSVLVTGFDIIFFWVARMMMMQLELIGEVPVPRRLHPRPRPRREGQEDVEVARQHPRPASSSSTSSAPTPCASPSTAMAAMGRDLKLSDDRIAGYRNFGTKLWNAARFAEMNDCRPDPAFDPTAVTLTANKWIVGETGRLRETLDAALDRLPLQRRRHRALRPRLGQGLRLVRRAGQAALRRRRRRRDPRHHGLGARPVPDPDAPGHALHHRGALGPDRRPPEAPLPHRLARLRRRADRPRRRRRDELGHRPDRGDPLGPRPDARPRRRPRHPGRPRPRRPARPRRWSATAPLVARLARVERFETAAEAPKGAVTLTVQGATFCLPLADVIDIAAERDRLAKTLDKLDKEAQGLRAKLANAAFVARAPEEVVDEQRTRLEAAEEEMQALSAAEARLATL